MDKKEPSESIAERAEGSSRPSTDARLSKLKTTFLYILIGGLVAAALLSVVALLIGQFNSVISKSLGTIFILFTHSLLILAVLWADRYNQVGKLLLPTAIVALVFLNMITSTLGIWDILSAETAWRAVGVYFLLAGAVFTLIGLLRLRVAHQVTQIALYSTIGFFSAAVITLIPWVLNVFAPLDPLYFRVIAALSILTTTAFIITVIIRSIALAQNESLKLTQPTSHPTTGSLLAIYITVGVLTAMVWCGGFAGFIVSAVQSSSPASAPYDDERYY